ncbi:MAG: DNA-processing protein DprA [Oscillospiraceae bacterium]|nr:DNA-processing protein DprA [Oscillospiraceae bacterium]MBQ7130191.1 DNA-processing protein DprA [Oscillospiraceae bacterium]
MLVHWIWFAHRPGLTDRMKRSLLQHFQDPEEMFFAGSDDFDFLEGLTEEGRESLRDKDLSQAENILAQCRKEGIHLLTIRDAGYPARLKNIDDPPVLLYYKGILPDLDGNPVIGVVGTRKASAYGLTTAKRMGYQIGRSGGIVVSGMAYGIDGFAMTGALTAGACVVGVLGCGADIVYPPSNRALFRDTERYGCIISEFAPGTPPARWTFPKRNRIIAGLSCGVLVVEAPEKSGALITARQALDQGRDVFAVPGNIDVPSFEGSNQLLRSGAIPVLSGWDVLSEYEAQFPDKIRRDTSPVRQTAEPEEVLRASGEEAPAAKVAQKPRQPRKKQPDAEKCYKKVIDKESSPPYSDVNDKLSRLSAEEQSIVAALKNGERLVDDVIAETGMTTGKLLAALTMLELKGMIRRLPGKRISMK